jgi:hypothetical protein
MNRKNTEACARFVARLRAVLEELGCRQATMSFYQYTLETRAGLLRVSVHPNSSSAGAWVAARFEEPRRATELLGHGFSDNPNPHTGKWNHHFFDEAFSTDESIAEAESHLRIAFARVRDR